MWFVFVTITTCGYGDITPGTTIGRFITILSALFGLTITATLIGIMNDYLTLSNEESTVVQFIEENTKIKMFKETALSCVTEVIRAYAKLRNTKTLNEKKGIKLKLYNLAASFKDMRK